MVQSTQFPEKVTVYVSQFIHLRQTVSGLHDAFFSVLFSTVHDRLKPTKSGLHTKRSKHFT